MLYDEVVFILRPLILQEFQIFLRRFAGRNVRAELIQNIFDFFRLQHLVELLLEHGFEFEKRLQHGLQILLVFAFLFAELLLQELVVLNHFVVNLLDDFQADVLVDI